MSRYILRSANKLIFNQKGDTLVFPDSLPEGISRHPASLEFTIVEYKAFDVRAECELPEGFVLMGLREANPRLSAEDYRAAVKAMELMHWDAGSRFCGACGRPLERSSEISKKCPACSREVFAQVSAAIIVLIHRGDEVLLVHARNFSRPYFGLVAGFVETGESLEECVRREVMEETSLRVKNIRYAGSQPWPYPNSLMLAFHAEYESGEIKFADGELTDGGFFSSESLPLLPPPPSIARRLIDEWLSERRTSR